MKTENRCERLPSFVAKDVSKYYDSLASKATKGTLDSNVVVLGKYEGDVPTSYQSVAQEKEKLYFELNIDEWNYYTKFLGDEGAWRINQTFIDQNVLLGREFQFSHDISTATGSFAREVEYLRSFPNYAYDVTTSSFKPIK